MTATLSFTLPEEQQEHMDAINGTAWRCVVLAVDQKLRDWHKYGTDQGASTENIQALRDFIRDEADARGLSLE